MGAYLNSLEKDLSVSKQLGLSILTTMEWCCKHGTNVTMMLLGVWVKLGKNPSVSIKILVAHINGVQRCLDNDPSDSLAAFEK